MRDVMRAAALRQAATDLLQAIASIPRRRYFWLLIAGVAGYCFGYKDAFRGPESLGWKFGELVDRLTPESVNEARRRNSEALRQRLQQGHELPQ